jgi:CheY-like chemotaxis protein
MLRSRGAEVLVADTGHAAISMLEEHPSIDGVLMDIMMPEMDGYAAMRRIRADARFHTLPIIALTAKAMRGDEEKCLEAGATAYLPKPIDPHRLLQILGVHLTRSS